MPIYETKICQPFYQNGSGSERATKTYPEGIMQRRRYRTKTGLSKPAGFYKGMHSEGFNAALIHLEEEG